MSLKIIGAGMGRTGTNSLKIALETLGFGPCHHMYEIRENPDLLPDWTAISQGGTPDWDRIFAGYSSQVDWPGAAFWRELAAYYPDAKVILTIRDPQVWFNSMQKTIVRSFAARHSQKVPFERAISTMASALIEGPIFDHKMENETHCINKFNAHIERVKSTVTAERLLVYDVKDGWGPLCRFLEVGVPELPFPLSNTTKDFNQKR